ncbi:MAG: hypothetical protein FWD88_05385, partial [Treponema sp.]|nr:hypothetical protein [Treponema sp.]
MGLKKNGFTKIVLAVALFAVLGAAIPQEKAFAQAGVTSCSIHENTFQANCQECMVVHRNLQRLLRHEQQQLLLWQQEQLRQQLQKQQRQNVVWQIQIVNANTFERIGDVTRVIARGVSSLDEARWNARRQLGFPADSDLRTAGGVPQRIIWGEPQRYDQPTEETAPGQFTAPEAPDPLRGLLPLPRRTTLAPTAPAEVEIAAPVVPAAPTPQPAVAAAQRRSGRTDWLSFEVRTWGAGIRYDRNINDIFSVGATFGGGTGIDQINSLLIGAMLATRFFPRGSPF